MIRLIVGLGNPGSQYEKTRHNAGFLFLDRLAETYGAKWSISAQFQGELASIDFAGRKLWLLKPMGFMNRSGGSVGKLARFYKIDVSSLLVVHDELDLPQGEVRMKHDGGHAGHNGVRDVIAHMGVRDFYRMRIGIGRPPEGVIVSDYVLSSFGKSENRGLAVLFDDVLSNGIDVLLAGDVSGFNALFVSAKTKNANS